MTLDHPRPSSLPGLASGRFPQVPAEPPARIPGASAADLGRRHLVIFVLATVAYVLVFAFADATPVLLGAGVAWFLLGWFLLGRVGDRLVDELKHGYTTLVINTGLFWIRVEGWTPWDFDGVWRYTRKGVQAPVAGVTDPPGLYPSPHRQGRSELWTGCVWTKVYRN